MSDAKFYCKDNSNIIRLFTKDGRLDRLEFSDAINKPVVITFNDLAMAVTLGMMEVRMLGED